MSDSLMIFGLMCIIGIVTFTAGFSIGTRTEKRWWKEMLAELGITITEAHDDN